MTAARYAAQVWLTGKGAGPGLLIVLRVVSVVYDCLSCSSIV